MQTYDKSYIVLNNFQKMWKVHHNVRELSIKYVNKKPINKYVKKSKRNLKQKVSSVDLTPSQLNQPKPISHLSLTFDAMIDEIIMILQITGKYDEWKQHGAKIGQINSIYEPFCDTYIYTCAYGGTIQVNQVFKYESNMKKNIYDKYIPVLSFCSVNKNQMRVNQGEYKIVNASDTLMTFGLSTCSCLVIQFGNKKFLAHIDATTNIFPMYNAIVKYANKQKFIMHAYIYVGTCIGYQYAMNKAYEICKKLNIDEKFIVEQTVQMFEDIFA